MTPDLAEQLADVAHGGDRDSPLVFVGRKPKLNSLQDTVNVSKRKGAWAGAARIVQGAPGMGKTALRDAFLRKTLRDQSQAVAESEKQDEQAAGDAADAKRAPSRSAFASNDDGEGADEPSFVTCVCISADELASTPLELVDTIDSRLRKPDMTLLGHRHLRAMAAGLVKRVTRGGDARSLVREHGLGLSAASSMTKCLDAYATHVWAPGAVIVLLIDEAQQCDVDDKHTQNNIRAIYNADHQARMPMLFFGLPDTGATLQKLGLSRLTDAAAESLGRLQGREGREVLDGSLKKLGLGDPVSSAWSEHLKDKGITEAQWGKWRDRIVQDLDEASQNFPQHLAVGQSAICKGLLRTQDDSVNFDDRLHQDIMADHEKRRRNYYQGRLVNAEAGVHVLALGAICELFHRRRNEAVEACEAERLVLDGWRSRTDAPAPDPSAVLTRAVSKGVFGRHGELEDDALAPPPIPSMQRHLRERFERALAKESRVAVSLSATLDALAPPAPDKRKTPAPSAP